MTYTSEYHIPRHVHFAIEDDVVVFMNLRSDQYSMLLGQEALLFEALLSYTQGGIRRLIAITCPREDEALPDRLALIAKLLENDLLTTDSCPDNSPIPIHIPYPEESLLDPSDPIPTQIRLCDVLRFVTACVAVTWRLTYRGIEHSVNTIERRNQTAGGRTRCDLATARKLVYIYNRLRPLFPKHFVCLFDSLSLLEFLGRNECSANLIFAVQLEPWLAHCWVQCGTVAFNQDVDRAQTYLPLLLV